MAWKEQIGSEKECGMTAGVGRHATSWEKAEVKCLEAAGGRGEESW